MAVPQPPIPFDYANPTRLVFGPDTIERLGELAAEWDSRRALIVTDQHLVEAGHAERAESALRRAGIDGVVYEGVHENPTTEDVQRCVEAARDAKIDTIVGLGGGSSLDTAKGANFLLTNGGSVHDYWGVGKATEPMLPLIAVPTTAGTGSECQQFALIADAETHQKMACGDPKAAARIAVLDPTLTTTQPRHVTANTGIDALTHAVETAVTNQRNDLSLMYSRQAFRRINAHLPAVLDSPDDIAARGQMQLAAALAGTAIAASMLGAAHAAANPLTAHDGVIHGQAVGLMLPAVVRYNARDETTAELYAELARDARLVPHEAPADAAVDALLRRIGQLLDAAGIPRALCDHGVEAEALPELARQAAQQWTARFNPRPVDEAVFAELYESTYESAAAK